MYTHNYEEQERLNDILTTLLLPAVRRAIADASRVLVYETEGFHPDGAYEASQQAAADELTLRLCQYFAGLSYRSERNLFEGLTPEDMREWLSTITKEVPVIVSE